MNNKWIKLPPLTINQSLYYHKKKKIQVIIETELHGETYWMHVSLSKKDRIPNYKELKFVKSEFIGEDKKAIQIFPTEKEFVNLHPYCLHLYTCDDIDNIIPDMRRIPGINLI